MSCYMLEMLGVCHCSCLDRLVSNYAFHSTTCSPAFSEPTGPSSLRIDVNVWKAAAGGRRSFESRVDYFHSIPSKKGAVKASDVMHSGLFAAELTASASKKSDLCNGKTT